ncbi:FAS1 domain-containing protein [Stipitochalara longipes BDJ]|nr:FAS1 domain-containing protein [Stipitochalara longipes BDJ]
MKPLRTSSLWWLATLVSHGWAITLLQVLQTYPQLSSLNVLVNSSANATALLANGNNFTFLAPSNDAISKFNSQNPGVLNSSQILPYIQYGLLKGGYPTLSITKAPQFIQSNLSDPTYANVTGGQAVELVVGSDGTPEFISGNGSISTSTTPDVVCVGGIIHILDSVLSIPVTTVLEITNAHLEYFVSILNVDNYLSASATYVNQILEVPDVTYFIPNSAAALAGATALAQNSSAADLEAIFQYYIVPGSINYSPMLKNGMNLKTQQGTDLTITLQDGDTYVNAAKVIASDLIVANGVVHVIDNLLNRFDTAGPPPPTTSVTTSTPAPTATQTINTPTYTSSGNSNSGMSTGAKAGLGVGVGVVGLALLSILAFLIFRHRRNKAARAASVPWDNSSMSGATASPFNKFYVQRGQVQRQEDPGLGLQSTGMAHVEDSGMAGREYGQIDGPSIPPRSPSRALRGDGKAYF